MSFLINLSHSERKTFARHFLSSVHSEIRYKAIEIGQILDKKDELISEFKLLGFSESKNIVEGAFHLEMPENEASKLSQKTTPLGMVFSSQSPKYELRVEKDKIVYSDFNYSSFEEYKSKFNMLFNKVVEILSIEGDLVTSKIGFRKVNSIAIQPFTSFQDGLSIFAPSLFSIARSGLLKFDKFKVNEETVVLEETNDKLFILRTRLLKTQADTIEATLDSDFVKLGTDMNSEEIFNDVLPALNQCHFDLFMWSVTDDMRKLMESE